MTDESTPDTTTTGTMDASTGAIAQAEASGSSAEQNAPQDEQLPRRAPWTLQRRLIVTVVGITSFIMVLVAVATSAILGQVLEAQLEAEVKSAQQSVEFMRVPISTGMTAEQILEQQPAPRPGFFLAVESTPGEPSAAVFDSDGEVVALSDEEIASIAESLKGQHGQFVVTVDGLGTYRIEGVPLGSAFAIVGLSRAGISDTLTRMLITIALLTVGGLMLLAVATAWTIRRGLAPLRAVADTAARVSSQQLDQGEVSISERVPAREADARTEVGRVGAALNTLLDHVDESLTARQRNEERMRSFVADASHELRTPLASIRGYSELSLTALGRGQSTALETTEASLERIQAQSLRMTSLVEDLLLLARLDEGQELVYGTVDLTRLAIDAVDATTTQSLERIQAQSLRMTGLVEDLLLLARLDEGQELVYGSV
ncbi:MAG TPA: histidine kinase dimerization/phospho-acceptor domain-containing protein, partial [Microbacterium sp.]|nr:histidine kinase dimerization/phospho-acceptor domain-containing protein [Microbacterium sp.]